MTEFGFLLLPVLAAALVSLWSVGRLTRVSGARWLDVPNPRSSHTRPTPRGGGLGLLAGAAAGIGLATLWVPAQPWPWALLAGALLVAATGLADDLRGHLPVALRLSAHVGAALVLVYVAGPLERVPLPPPADVNLGWAAIPLSLLWIVGVTNIYNFLDGIDGFAAVQGVVVGGALAVALWPGPEGILALILAAGCAGFLVHNWHPARIFMGDVGSATLGFLFAAIPLSAAAGPESKAGLVWLAGMALWFFLADGAFTLLRRAVRREPVWRAHRSHLYQRLVRTGWSHARVTASVGAAAAVLAAVSVATIIQGGSTTPWAVTAAAGFALVAYWGAVVRRERAQSARLKS